MAQPEKLDCRHCGGKLVLLVRMKRARGGYLAYYHCETCAHVLVVEE